MAPKKKNKKKPKQAKLDHIQEDSEHSGLQNSKKKKRKQKKTKLIEKFWWTRIVRRCENNNDEIGIYVGLDDLEFFESREYEDYCDEISPLKLHFHPEAFEEEDWPKKHEENRPSPEELMNVA
jgi:hypothetical protein